MRKGVKLGPGPFCQRMWTFWIITNNIKDMDEQIHNSLKSLIFRVQRVKTVHKMPNNNYLHCSYCKCGHFEIIKAGFWILSVFSHYLIIVEHIFLNIIKLCKTDHSKVKATYS